MFRPKVRLYFVYVVIFFYKKFITLITPKKTYRSFHNLVKCNEQLIMFRDFGEGPIVNVIHNNKYNSVPMILAVVVAVSIILSVKVVSIAFGEG